MAINLLSIAAVPFISEGSVGARRLLRRPPADPATLSILNQVDPEQRMIIAVIMNEAALAIQSVIHPPEQVAETPSQPPNSPNGPSATAATTNFEFPPPDLINSSDGLANPSPRQTLMSSSTGPEDQASSSEELVLDRSAEKSRQKRTLRKRRRVPSFKTSTAPRVPPKFSCSEADDEDEDEDGERMPQVPIGQAASVQDHDHEELQLRLNLLSETRKESSSSGDWAKVGRELRQIADNFQRTTHGEDDVDHGSGDLFSMINQMLPIALPHSFWSALVSYAAWKIFNKFQ